MVVVLKVVSAVHKKLHLHDTNLIKCKRLLSKVKRFGYSQCSNDISQKYSCFCEKSYKKNRHFTWIWKYYMSCLKIQIYLTSILFYVLWIWEERWVQRWACQLALILAQHQHSWRNALFPIFFFFTKKILWPALIYWPYFWPSYKGKNSNNFWTAYDRDMRFGPLVF